MLFRVQLSPHAALHTPLHPGACAPQRRRSPSPSGSAPAPPRHRRRQRSRGQCCRRPNRSGLLPDHDLVAGAGRWSSWRRAPGTVLERRPPAVRSAGGPSSAGVSARTLRAQQVRGWRAMPFLAPRLQGWTAGGRRSVSRPPSLQDWAAWLVPSTIISLRACGSLQAVPVARGTRQFRAWRYDGTAAAVPAGCRDQRATGGARPCGQSSAAAAAARPAAGLLHPPSLSTHLCHSPRSQWAVQNALGMFFSMLFLVVPALRWPLVCMTPVFTAVALLLLNPDRSVGGRIFSTTLFTATVLCGAVLGGAIVSVPLRGGGTRRCCHACPRARRCGALSCGPPTHLSHRSAWRLWRAARTSPSCHTCQNSCSVWARGRRATSHSFKSPCPSWPRRAPSPTCRPR